MATRSGDEEVAFRYDAGNASSECTDEVVGRLFDSFKTTAEFPGPARLTGA